MPDEHETHAYACPACASVDVVHSGSHDSYRLLTCRVCGAGFSDPMKESREFYEQSEDYVLRDQLIVDPLQWEKRWDIDLFLRLHPTGKGRLLDVGCGTGFFVRRATDIGFEAWGVETDVRAVKQGEKYFGLSTLSTGTLAGFIESNPGARFDLITMFQVLEHLENPEAVIEQVRDILAPDGLLVLALPWAGRWPDVLGEVDLPPHHLSRWSRKAIHTFLQREGFSVRQFVVEGFPLWNMTGVVYRIMRRFMPGLTLAGSRKGAERQNVPETSKHLDTRSLERRRTKIRLALAASTPAWLVLKLLGARGPHMYIEASPERTRPTR